MEEDDDYILEENENLLIFDEDEFSEEDLVDELD